MPQVESCFRTSMAMAALVGWLVAVLLCVGCITVLSIACCRGLAPLQTPVGEPGSAERDRAIRESVGYPRRLQPRQPLTVA